MNQIDLNKFSPISHAVRLADYLQNREAYEPLIQSILASSNVQQPEHSAFYAEASTEGYAEENQAWT